MVTLARRLTLTDAVVIGLGSMIGAGVFAVWAPAAAAAGDGLLIALVVAGAVAYANATSSAQLAARYPTSGGSYAYGRAELGPWWGFLAGWGFVIGKTASCAAMALTVAAYLVPAGPWQRPLAAGVVLALTAVNYRGVTRTAALARVIVATVGLILVTFVASAFATPAALGASMPTGGYGVLQAAGLIFFAFAGYARIATLGEEVIEPVRVIPRAITWALGLALTLYLLIAVAVTRVLPADRLAASKAPLAEAAAAVAPWLEPVVRIAGGLAATGALLALIAGVSRTTLAMAREGDLPSTLAAIHPRFQVPHHAEVALAAVVATIVLAIDLRGAIGFSSFGVLIYYAAANAAAWRQREGRLFPRWLQGFGMVACLGLVVTLPWPSVAVGAAVLALGVGYRLIRLRQR